MQIYVCPYVSKRIRKHWKTSMISDKHGRRNSGISEQIQKLHIYYMIMTLLTILSKTMESSYARKKSSLPTFAQKQMTKTDIVTWPKPILSRDQNRHCHVIKTDIVTWPKHILSRDPMCRKHWNSRPSDITRRNSEIITQCLIHIQVQPVKPGYDALIMSFEQMGKPSTTNSGYNETLIYPLRGAVWYITPPDYTPYELNIYNKYGYLNHPRLL